MLEQFQDKTIYLIELLKLQGPSKRREYSWFGPFWFTLREHIMVVVVEPFDSKVFEEGEERDERDEIPWILQPSPEVEGTQRRLECAK